MLVLRQLFDPPSSTYRDLLGDRAAGEAILIDPVFEQAARDAALLRELDLRLTATLDTHVHADHVTGAWLLKNRLGAKIALSAASGAEGADIHLADGDRVRFGACYVTALATPGPTGGCMTFVLDEESLAFTGDALLIRGCGRKNCRRRARSTEAAGPCGADVPDDPLRLLQPRRGQRGVPGTRGRPLTR